MSTRFFALLLSASIIAGVSSHNPALSAQGAGSPVVISQVYGGGGNSGATLRHDFIELFNRSASPVDLTGWSVQYASTAGTTWARTDLTSVVLRPGGYYLIQQATGAAGSQDLPTPDAAGTIAMSGTAGKVALVANQVTLTGPCPAALDFVGYGPATSCAENAPTASNLGNTTAAVRKLAGCQDTNSNVDDFANGPPTPRNTASPAAPCMGPTPLAVVGSATPPSIASGDPVLVTATVTPASAPASSGVIVTADLSAIGGSTTASLFDDGSNGDVAADDGVFSLSTIVMANTPAGLRALAVTAVDLQLRIATDGFTVQVTAPLVVRLPHEVQGPGAVSPFVGQQVAVEGVVTGRKSNGFFVQTAPALEDGDPHTSEGLFVFTAAAPPATAAVGSLVRVSGTVAEFAGGAAEDPTLTELTAPAVAALGSADLPAPVALDADDLTPGGGLLQWEPYEGMRVSLAPIVVVAPTGGFVDEPDALGGSNGVFYAVFTGQARPLREAGVPALDPVPLCDAGVGCNVPIFDVNPERIRIDSDGLVGAPALNVTTGTVFGNAQGIGNVLGIVEYGFRTWTVLPVPPPLGPALAPVGGMSALAVPAPTAEQFTVASFNTQRFYDTVNDAGTSDEVLTATAFQNRLAKLSLLVRHVLQAPDILGVQEAENLTTLQAIASRINADAQAAGLDNPGYSAILQEGNDIGGIDVGFLVRSRVSVLDVRQWGRDLQYTNPLTGEPELLNDRPSLSLRATIHGGPSNRMPGEIIVVVSHLRSLIGVDDPDDGPRVRAKRQAQAEFLAGVLHSLQSESPGVPVVSVGDYNAFSVNDGFVDVVGIVRGNSAPPTEVALSSPDLVTPDFVDAANSLPADERYSYVFDGNAQSLDHVLLSQSAIATFAGFGHARVSADFPEVFRSDPTRPERLSDHDPAVAYFLFPPDTVPPVMANVPASITVQASSPAGASVTWPEPGATDNLSGAVDVICWPASGSTFAIGTSTVSCQATDASGNVATASFPVTVVDPTTPGRLSGAGTLGTRPRVAFAFAVQEAGEDERGVLVLTVLSGAGLPQVLVSRRITSVFFFEGGRRAAFSGDGWWNGVAGHTFEVVAEDRGEPGRGRDLLSIVMRNAQGAALVDVAGAIRDGSIH